MTESERELIDRTKKFRQDVSDWLASQEMTNPLAEKPGEDTVSRILRVHDAVRAYGPDSGLVKHDDEFRASYDENFSARSALLFEDFTAAGVVPATSIRRYTHGFNAAAVTCVLQDFKELIDALEARR